MRQASLFAITIVCLTACAACSERDGSRLPFTWESVDLDPRPPARSDASLAVDGDRVFLFGGRNEAHCLNDLWVLAGSPKRWEKIPTAAGPTPRSGAVLLADHAAGRLILYGGSCHDQFGQVHFFSDLWFFSEEGGWQREYLAGGPGHRGWQAAVMTDRGPILYGGIADSPPYHRNDVWLLDLGAMAWKRIATDGGTRMAGRPGLMASADGATLTVLGRQGLPQAVGTVEWSLDLPQDRWTQKPGAGSERPRPDYDLLLGHPKSGVWLVLQGPDEQTARWRGWTRLASGPLAWHRGRLGKGPDTPVGMACAALPGTEPDWICFGGAQRSRLSDATFRLRARTGPAGEVR